MTEDHVRNHPLIPDGFHGEYDSGGVLNVVQDEADIELDAKKVPVECTCKPCPMGDYLTVDEVCTHPDCTWGTEHDCPVHGTAPELPEEIDDERE